MSEGQKENPVVSNYRLGVVSHPDHPGTAFLQVWKGEEFLAEWAMQSDLVAALSSALSEAVAKFPSSQIVVPNSLAKVQ